MAAATASLMSAAEIAFERSSSSSSLRLDGRGPLDSRRYVVETTTATIGAGCTRVWMHDDTLHLLCTVQASLAVHEQQQGDSNAANQRNSATATATSDKNNNGMKLTLQLDRCSGSITQPQRQQTDLWQALLQELVLDSFQCQQQQEEENKEYSWTLAFHLTIIALPTACQAAWLDAAASCLQAAAETVRLPAVVTTTARNAKWTVDPDVRHEWDPVIVLPTLVTLTIGAPPSKNNNQVLLLLDATPVEEAGSTSRIHVARFGDTVAAVRLQGVVPFPSLPAIMEKAVQHSLDVVRTSSPVKHEQADYHPNESTFLSGTFDFL